MRFEQSIMKRNRNTSYRLNLLILIGIIKTNNHQVRSLTIVPQWSVQSECQRQVVHIHLGMHPLIRVPHRSEQEMNQLWATILLVLQIFNTSTSTCVINSVFKKWSFTPIKVMHSIFWNLWKKSEWKCILNLKYSKKMDCNWRMWAQKGSNLNFRSYNLRGDDKGFTCVKLILKGKN